ncbi:MAG: glycosyltransferase, partial [Saprospiraceae bacterium]
MTLLKNDQTSYDKTKVVVIIATYNGSKYIVNCIQSILEGYIIPQIIMIDNNSSDATIELVRKTFQEIKIIKLSQNQGFGFANNIGIKYALEELKADYFFLLNQDTVVERNTIQNLLKVAKKNP